MMMQSKTKKKPQAAYTRADFHSKNGFLTDVWGPSMWLVLHTISFNYPCDPTDEQKETYRAFFDALWRVLPCGKCRDNLCKNLKCTRYGPHVYASREALSRWVYRLHACVNKMLHKPNDYTYAEVRSRFENFRARCGGPAPRSSRRKRKKKEDGCTRPLPGHLKSKCLLQIVPKDECGGKETMTIDRRCVAGASCVPRP